MVVVSIYRIFCFNPTTGKLKLSRSNENDPHSGYRLCFSYKEEHAKLGLYRVRHSDYGINSQERI